MKKAIVIGSTGMVGKQLIQLLIENEAFSEVVSLVRRSSGIIHPKFHEIIVNFDEPETWSKFVSGNVLFSCMGTTIAQAKTKDEQYKVDFTYQFTVAEIAAKNGISNYVLVSSAGADSKSNIFYSKMKGKLENAVQSLPFEYISILRPGLLVGNRIEKRVGEKIGFLVLNAFNKLGLFKKYKPIMDVQVAKAMIKASSKINSASYTLDEVFKLTE